MSAGANPIESASPPPARWPFRLFKAAVVVVLLTAGFASLPKIVVPVIGRLGVLPEGAVFQARMSWAGPGALRAEDVVVTWPGGELAAHSALLDLGLPLGGSLVRSLRLVAPRAAFSSGSDRLMRPSENEGTWSKVTLERLQVEDGVVERFRGPGEGEDALDWRIERLDFLIQDLETGPSLAGTLERLSFRALAPSLPEPLTVGGTADLSASGGRIELDVSSSRSRFSFSGTGRVGPDLDRSLRSLRGVLVAEPLVLDDLRPFLGPWIPSGTVSADLDVGREPGSAEGVATVDLGPSGQARFSGEIRAEESEPIRVVAVATTENLLASAIGIPSEGRIAGNLDIAFSGLQWDQLSGEVTGEILSTRPELAGELEVRSVEGQVDGGGDFRWDRGRLVVSGTGSFSEVGRPWALDTRVTQGADSIHVVSSGQGSAGEFVTSGTLRGTPVVSSGTWGQGEGAWASLRVNEIPEVVDSLRLEVGRDSVRSVLVRAHRSADTAELLGSWSSGALLIDHLTTTGWRMRGAEWSGTAEGVLRPGSGGLQGQLSFEVLGARDREAGRPGRTHAHGSVAFEGRAARIDAKVERDSAQAFLAGSLSWSDAGLAATLNELQGHARLGGSAVDVTWVGELGLTPTRWLGGGQLTLLPNPRSAGSWAATIDVATADGILQGRGSGEVTSAGELQALLNVEGGWRDAKSLSLRVEADPLVIPIGGSHSIATVGAASVELPIWSTGLSGGRLDANAKGRIGDLPLDSLRVSGRIEGSDKLAFEMRVDGPGYTGRLEGEGRRSDASFALDSAFVRGSVTSDSALLLASRGQLRGTGRAAVAIVDSPQGGPTLTGGVTMESLGGSRWDATSAEVELEDLSVVTSTGRATATLSGLALLGGPRHDMNLTLEAETDVVDLRADWGRELGLSLTGHPGNRLVTFEAGNLRVGLDTLRLVEPAVLQLAQGRSPREKLRFGGPRGQRIDLEVRRLPDDALTATAELHALEAASVLFWAPENFDGLTDARVSGQGRITTTDGRRTGQATVELSGGADSGELVSLDAAVKVDQENVEVRAGATVGDQAAALEIDAAEAGLVRGLIRADRFPLGLLVSGVSGEAYLDGELSWLGVEESSHLEGEARLFVERWDFPRAEVEINRVDLTMRAEEGGIRVAGSATSEGGAARVSGRVLISEESPDPTLDLTVRTDRFPVAWSPEFVLRTVGDVKVTGTVGRPRVSGALRAEASDIFLVDGSAVEEVELLEQDLLLLREQFGWVPRRPTTGSWLSLEALSVDVEVNVGGDVWVRRSADPELAVSLSGSTRITKGVGQPFQLFGTLEPSGVGSAFWFFGRRFDIVSGEVGLVGPIENVDLSITGRHEVASRSDPGEPEAVIEVTVQGSPENLSVVFESEPSMDQADIVSYLLLGQASGVVGSAETGAAGAGGAITLSRLTGVLRDAAAKSIGLDVVDVEASGSDGVTLVAGRYLTPRLFVMVRQPVTPGDGPAADRSAWQPGLEAELRAAQWLLVNLAGDAEGFGLRLRTRRGF